MSAGLTVYNPGKWLPRMYKPTAAARYTERQRLQQARAYLRANGSEKTILYVWRPEYSSALNAIDYDVSCYHIDDEYTFAEVERPMDDRERRLVTGVDQVFVHSVGLWEKKGRLNRNTLIVPNGVDYGAYAGQQTEPEDMKNIPRPRMGYIGVIKPQLDIPLLIDLAERHPDWSFVLVGPLNFPNNQTQSVQGLAEMRNTYFLGDKSVADLPAYAQYLDVCMLCYRIDGYTKFIYPLKLHEYLASGRPVVGTPIRTLEEFRDVIRLARTGAQWSRALTQSLDVKEQSPARIAQRRRVAREYDWDKLVHVVAGALCERLGRRYVERLDKLSESTTFHKARFRELALCRRNDIA
jgi:glycosyltransferase involved in cell wall biosynthesis